MRREGSDRNIPSKDCDAATGKAGSINSLQQLILEPHGTNTPSKGMEGVGSATGQANNINIPEELMLDRVYVEYKLHDSACRSVCTRRELLDIQMNFERDRQLLESLFHLTEDLSRPAFLDGLLTVRNRRQIQSGMEKTAGPGWVSNISRFFGSFTCRLWKPMRRYPVIRLQKSTVRLRVRSVHTLHRCAGIRLWVGLSRSLSLPLRTSV